MKFNKSSGSTATKTSNQAYILPADTGKVESTIADVLKNTKVIENFLDENNILPKSNKVLDIGTGMPSELNSSKELADYLIQDADILQRISAIMLKTILENDVFKQSRIYFQEYMMQWHKSMKRKVKTWKNQLKA